MGPMLVAKWIPLIVCCLTSPPPAVVSLDTLDCRAGFTVESSWCTKHRKLPYTCTQSNGTIPKTQKSDYALITEKNLTIYYMYSFTYVENSSVVNISLEMTQNNSVTPNIYISLTPPTNFYFSKVHVGEISTLTSDFCVSLCEDIGCAAYLFNKTYASVNSTKTIPSKDFDLLPSESLWLRFKGDIRNVKMSFLFESAYNPASQLQVFCDANKKGHIQTYNWDGLMRLYTRSNVHVTIEIPDDHIIMVSLVSLDVYDKLCISTEADCTSPGCKRILENFKPTVYRKARAISICFNSGWEIQGFRLLFSFHPKSRQPTKLLTEMWNCSVPFLSDFKQHFTCSPEVLCSGDQDVVGWCTNQDICGTAENMVQWERNGYCYRLFKPSHNYTWIEAAMKCRTLRGRLMNLNSKDKRELIINITSRYRLRNAHIIYVGFQKTSRSNMYKYTWVWSDDTLVVFLPIFYKYDGSFENCGYVSTFYRDTAFATSCSEKNKAFFLCENENWRDENYGKSKESTPKMAFPSVTATLSKGIVRCILNHTAHNFLACDADTNCSAVDMESSRACSNREDPAIPFFMCRGHTQLVPYSLLCDYRKDCCDSSDEDFCLFPECQNNEFTCLHSKQCIPSEEYCDGHFDCVDASDESNCDVTQADFPTNKVPPPAVVTFTGKGNILVTPLGTHQCPDTHFRCPGNGTYCMPVYVRCNDVNDCPGKEDEADCDAYTCPGLYRCRGSKICVHKQHLCDSVAHCPQRDDELMCNTNCPEHCTCYGYAFICTGVISPAQHPSLRYLEASGTGMDLSNFPNNRYLIHLGLRRCGVDNIGDLYLPNLQSLDLSYNNLHGASVGSLSSLPNLRVLSLAHNPFINLIDMLNRLPPFPQISSLNVSGLSMPAWPDNFCVLFPNVRILNLSDSGLDRLPVSGFQSLTQLQTLDLKGCPLSTFYPGVFDDLPYLRTVLTDNYKICCPVVTHRIDNFCKAPTDELSSCDALLRTVGFRVFLVLYAFLSLFGNCGSFVYRTVVDKIDFKTGFEVFVTHLCVADFLMGVYLAIIGMADLIYYGNYVWNDIIWRHSTACKLAGFLSLLSSEVSVFLICLITLERLLVIRFPFKRWFTRRMAHVACCIMWFVGLLLATIPLILDSEFYSRSSICIPLPITSREFDTMSYAFVVMVGLNFMLFVLIAIGQLFTYWSFRASKLMKSKDTVIARRLLEVVITDFLCWFPIGLLGILVRLGVPVSGEVNVAMAVFVLPLNSAINPFLYTFNLLSERYRVAGE